MYMPTHMSDRQRNQASHLIRMMPRPNLIPVRQHGLILLGTHRARERTLLAPRARAQRMYAHMHARHATFSAGSQILSSRFRLPQHKSQLKHNAEGEEIPAEPSLEEIHSTVTRCLEQPFSKVEEHALNLAYSTLPLAADRSDVKVPGHRFEENWIEFLRKSTLGDGVDVLDKLVASEGRFGTQQQLLADITKSHSQASVECTHLSTMNSFSVRMQLSIPKRCLLTSTCTLHTARKSILKLAYVSCKDAQNARAKLWMLCGSLNGH